ncbi:MAG: hypothetical protein ACOC3T_02590 [Bacteroidota bacterium]
MKDTVITGLQKKKEFKTLLICFALAFILNILAIHIYDASIIELTTSLHYVLLLSIFFYLFWVIVRLIIYSVRKLFQNNN